MGLYAEQVLPRIINVACGMKVTDPLRRRVCEGLAGDVVEIGFETGSTSRSSASASRSGGSLMVAPQLKRVLVDARTLR